MQHPTAEDIIICSGSSIYLKDIVYYIFDKLSIDCSKLVLEKSLFRPVDIEDIYGDNSKAKNVIGWNYDLDFYKVIDLIIEEEIANN